MRTVKARFFADLRTVFGVRMVDVPLERAPDIGCLLDLVCDTPQRQQAVFAAPGVPRREIAVLVNGRNIRFLDRLETKLCEGDEVAIFPPVYGG